MPFLNPPFLIAILVAITVHEWAHGMVARTLGDPTAEHEGRLTLNPIAHIDLLGALMFLVVGFGWAKPVPVNPLYFRYPKRDTAVVSLAGPAANLVLSFLAFGGLLLLGTSVSDSPMDLLSLDGAGNPLRHVLVQIFADSIFINLGLMAFNLLPIAPLDGSKILHLFIPVRYEDEYVSFMQRGPMILLVLIVLGAFAGVPILSAWVFGIVRPILEFMTYLAGFAG